jgi:hypothetical protein
MVPTFRRENSGFHKLAVAAAVVFLSTPVVVEAQQSGATQQPATAQSAPKPSTPAPPNAMAFSTPQEAAAALIAAAGSYDETALLSILGPDGKDLISSGEPALDKQRSLDFAAQAKEKNSVSVDPKTGSRAFLLVGDEDWPFAAPIVKVGNKWYFDAKAGQRELLYRRIGANELDAIQICEGYVDAQYDYAYRQRNEYAVAQYAQKIVATPGQKDGLAWQNADGTWEGPVSEKIAEAIEQGYTFPTPSYHGYMFKILKGQGPDAPLGKMNYVIEGAMIGGFALVAAPADYRKTGVMTFIVSNDGVVYQKDFGKATADEFKKMELFNPDSSWTPVLDQ